MNVKQEVDMNKKRGRPPEARVQGQISPADVELSRSEERSPQRAPRVRMEAGKRLVLDSRAGYHRRWFQDRPGRLDQAKAAYWEFVRDHTGATMSRPSGPYKMYAMEIEDRYWEEDQALKLKKSLDTLQAEQKLAPDEYVPQGRTHVLEKDDYDPLA